MRHGCREQLEDAGLIHQLNQRYRQEFDRAERLRAELVAIQGSRLWPWFCRLRAWGQRWRSLFGRRLAASTFEAGQWWKGFTHQADDPLQPSQVSVVIPFRDQPDLLSACVQSLRRTAAGVEMVLVDNGSRDARTHSLLKELKAGEHLRVITREEPFNFATLCNAGAKTASREVLLFLNNDVTAVEPGWLEELLEVASDRRVGVVGATLLYPDRTLQHAGLAATGPGAAWEHPYRFYPENHAGDEGELHMVRTVPAVTGACLLIRRALFDQVGGFDERHAVTMNDVDLCRRVREAGLEVVMTPHARLWHFESLSRGYQRESA